MFVKSEKSLKIRDGIGRALGKSLFPAIASAALGGLFVIPLSLWHYVVGAGALLALGPFVYVVCTSGKNYLTKVPQ